MHSWGKRYMMLMMINRSRGRSVATSLLKAMKVRRKKRRYKAPYASTICGVYVSWGEEDRTTNWWLQKDNQATSWLGIIYQKAKTKRHNIVVCHMFSRNADNNDGDDVDTSQGECWLINFKFSILLLGEPFFREESMKNPFQNKEDNRQIPKKCNQ